MSFCCRRIGSEMLFSQEHRCGRRCATLSRLSITRRHYLAQQPSADDVKKTNNPLTSDITVSLGTRANGTLYLNQGANSFLFRGVLPYKLGPAQIVQFTRPVVTTPNTTRGESTGLGDLNLFDLAIFPLEKAQMAVGFGASVHLSHCLGNADRNRQAEGWSRCGTRRAAQVGPRWKIADLAALVCRRRDPIGSGQPRVPASAPLQPTRQILSAVNCSMGA